MIVVKIPIEPVAASRPRFTKRGITYIAQEYRYFKTTLETMIISKYKGEPLKGPLEVCVLLTLSKPKTAKREFPSVRPDIDNFCKAVFDAANEVLWEDDAQIVELHAFKTYGEPSITISVKQKREEE